MVSKKEGFTWRFWIAPRELEKTEEELEGRIRRCGVKGYLVLDRGYYRYQKENGKRILLDPNADAALIHSD